MNSATEIQRLAFDPIAKGRDVFGRSRTGTGKSLAFLLPALQRFASYRDDVKDRDVSILVISPMKELSMQLASVARSLTQNFKGAGGKRPFKVCTVIGKNGAAEFASARTPCDMLVATPGVASDRKGGGLAKLLMTSPDASARLDNVMTIVLDEGDELTSGGFLDAIKEIDSHVKRSHSKTRPGKGRYQMLVFSATLPPELVTSKMMRTRITDMVHADTVGHGHKANVRQEAVVANAKYHTQVLVAAIKRHAAEISVVRGGGGDASDSVFKRSLAAQLAKLPVLFKDLVSDEALFAAIGHMTKPTERPKTTRGRWKALVFVSSSMYVEYAHEALSSAMVGAEVFKIHGKMTPGARSKASDAFRKCKQCILVSTDASASGMDYDGITAVVQVGFTSRSEFLQRAGRVGRAGAQGHSVAIFDPAEAERAMRRGCVDPDEMCIGDMVESGQVTCLNVRATSEDASVGTLSSSGRSLLFSPSLSFVPSKSVKRRLGGVASNSKRLRILHTKVVEWAMRFAEGLGFAVDRKSVEKKLNL